MSDRELAAAEPKVREQQEKRRLVSVLAEMGIPKSFSVRWGGENDEAMQAILDLKNNFDPARGEFTR